MSARPPAVAVLLATHNGERFIEAQVASLGENATPFTLHWLDDQSTDGTPEKVRAASARGGIELRECHESERQKLPGAYFRLLERVPAEVYLFCDQDDIWQPGKIDAAVAGLSSEPHLPRLCYSEPWLFRTESPTKLSPYFRAIGTDARAACAASRAFVMNPAVGNTMSFTRGLRELFLRHREIACSHAAMHDYWMYLIALASGGVQMLRGAPTTLYRQHSRNAVGVQAGAPQAQRTPTRRFYRSVRGVLAHQARGFVVAAQTLPASPRLDELLAAARLIARLDERCSLPRLTGLARRGFLPVPWRSAAWLALSCLLEDARRAQHDAPVSADGVIAHPRAACDRLGTD